MPLKVYCHPEPNSFNGWLRDIAIKTFKADGNKFEVSDLYAEKFDPVETSEHYRNRVVTEKFEPLSEQRIA